MKFETLFKELQNNRKVFRHLLAGMTQQEAQNKADEQAWSMLEVVCHLYDEEREDFREHLDFILHRQNEEWHVIDPQSWVTGRNYNKQDFAQMQERFLVIALPMQTAIKSCNPSLPAHAQQKELACP